MQRHIGAFDESDLTALEALLEFPDNDLADWLTGQRPLPEDANTGLLQRIKDEAGQ